mmetsp:Transcript_38922/g.97327  ORF Transcript_38922/g.97327 Transcript_38922/m.97327 type:complete len:222 (+) Transcript_38922:929-1594(+)
MDLLCPLPSHPLPLPLSAVGLAGSCNSVQALQWRRGRFVAAAGFSLDHGNPGRLLGLGCGRRVGVPQTCGGDRVLRFLQDGESRHGRPRGDFAGMSHRQSCGEGAEVGVALGWTKAARLVCVRGVRGVLEGEGGPHGNVVVDAASRRVAAPHRRHLDVLLPCCIAGVPRHGRMSGAEVSEPLRHVAAERPARGAAKESRRGVNSCRQRGFHLCLIHVSAAE